jgi:hypothetical protein
MNLEQPTMRTTIMTRIDNVTILVLGSQIAYHTAYSGFEVVAYDISDALLETARNRFERLAAHRHGRTDRPASDPGHHRGSPPPATSLRPATRSSGRTPATSRNTTSTRTSSAFANGEGFYKYEKREQARRLTGCEQTVNGEP